MPRREHTQRDDYDVLVGMNRHSITPTGWAHEQDNYKLALAPEGRRIVAREIGLNTYIRDDAYDFSIAIQYWNESEKLWRAINEHWAQLRNEHDIIRLADEIDEQKLYHHVMPIVDAYMSGEIETVAHAMEKLETVLRKYSRK